jgi:hypothetical protein
MSDFLEKIKKLPEKEKSFFLSDEPLFILKKAFGIYQIDSRLSKNIALEISQIYIDNLGLKDLPAILMKNVNLSDGIAYGIAYELNRNIFNKFPDHFKNSGQLLQEWERIKSSPVVSEEEAWRKVLEIEPWMAEVMREKRELKQTEENEEKKHQASLVKLSLSQALKQYTKLENQQITDGLIKLRYSDFPSRPTIKNWITDYYQNLGVGNHGIIERGNFLFHSENCKKLGSKERQKLALIFKSLSENMPLVIDAVKQQIIFPEIKEDVTNGIKQEKSGIKPVPPTVNPAVSDTGRYPISEKRNAYYSETSPRRPKEGEKVKFFSGQEMQPAPPVSQDLRQETITKVQDTNFEAGKKTENASNVKFSSPQKLSAESEKKDIGNSTLRIYPSRYWNGAEENGNPKMQDVKTSGNIVDLKNKG